MHDLLKHLYACVYINYKKYSYFLDMSPWDSSPCVHGESCIRQGITCTELGVTVYRGTLETSVKLVGKAFMYMFIFTN